MKDFRVEAIAQTEFEEAAVWYEGQRPGLGLEFIAEVDRVLVRILRTRSRRPSCSPRMRSSCQTIQRSAADRQTPLKVVPYFNFAPIENALARVKASAKTYDAALAAKGAALPAATKAKLVELAGRTEQALLMEPGLPGGRGWYKNMIYAPGRFTGYGAKTLPGVREAIEDERWTDVDTYAAMIGKALTAYADRLEEGVALIHSSSAPARAPGAR